MLTPFQARARKVNRKRQRATRKPGGGASSTAKR